MYIRKIYDSKEFINMSTMNVLLILFIYYTIQDINRGLFIFSPYRSKCYTYMSLLVSFQVLNESREDASFRYYCLNSYYNSNTLISNFYTGKNLPIKKTSVDFSTLFSHFKVSEHMSDLYFRNESFRAGRYLLS